MVQALGMVAGTRGGAASIAAAATASIIVVAIVVVFNLQCNIIAVSAIGPLPLALKAFQGLNFRALGRA